MGLVNFKKGAKSHSEALGISDERVKEISEIIREAFDKSNNLGEMLQHTLEDIDNLQEIVFVTYMTARTSARISEAIEKMKGS